VTGYRSQHFRWNCELRGCYYEQLPDWDDLIECFPRSIRPTDVDGLVEINGNALFLEEKGPGVSLHEGQRKALRNLSRRPGITTVFMRPLVREVSDLQCLVLGQGPADGWQPRSRDEFKQWLRDWAEQADRFPYIPELGGEAALPFRDTKV
jgi:hypothetical protein